MFDDLKGKRVLITGSSKGIGLATAKAFLAQGAKVGINGRDPSFDASVLKDACCCSGEFEYFQEDLSTSAACKNLVDRFVKRFTGIDVVINNAGALGGRRVIDDIDDAKNAILLLFPGFTLVTQQNYSECVTDNAADDANLELYFAGIFESGLL